MLRALRNEARSADIMHSHGMWMMTNVYPGWAIRGGGCRLVISPRGTLSATALRRSRWKKQLMWLLCQRAVVRGAACFHATAASEREQIRALGLRAPIAVIPNGVDIPALPIKSASGRRRLLYLGRIHPIKGLDTLIRAWAQLHVAFEDWELHLVGPDEHGFAAELTQLVRRLGVERVSFRGPLYGDAKLEEFRKADLYVLPSHTENFAMSVAEALAAGVPCVVSKGAPWAGLEDHGCGYWYEDSEPTLTECLRTALTLSDARLQEMGARGRQWMTQDFSWQRVGAQMAAAYEWLIGGGAPPAFVDVA
jgi:glycosyltransferase involved in cell wall biosynthesis